jgi:hypothetical protein
MDRIFNDLPIWGIFVSTLILVVASLEGGYLWARHRQREQDNVSQQPMVALRELLATSKP